MALILDLVRHGHAEASSPTGDEGRRLSERGRGDIARLAGRLRAEGPAPSRVFTSPLVRARETASILIRGWRGAPEAEPTFALVPDAEPGEMLEVLEVGGACEGHVLLVGHQPLLGDLADFLTGAPAVFRPGSGARIAFDGAPAKGRGRLVRTLHPDGA